MRCSMARTWIVGWTGCCCRIGELGHGGVSGGGDASGGRDGWEGPSQDAGVNVEQSLFDEDNVEVESGVLVGLFASAGLSQSGDARHGIHPVGVVIGAALGRVRPGPPGR